MNRAASSEALRYPAATYFLLTFTVSWLCAFLVAMPHLRDQNALPTRTGILMFALWLVVALVTKLYGWDLTGKTPDHSG